MENTPVYEKIQESCQSFVESQKKQELTSPGTEEQTGFIEGTGITGTFAERT